MATIENRKFVVLAISGANYISWTLDVKLHLNAQGLGKTIDENNDANVQERSKALIFIRHHIDDSLKHEYLTVEDPLLLWNELKERYDHLKTVMLPKAQAEYADLRFQDFKSVTEYNSRLFKVVSMLRLCGHKVTDAMMLEKTFSTFHASNMLLMQHYRGQRFTKYSELINCLLVAEQHNELLMKNHNARPTGSAPFSEINAISRFNRGGDRGRGRGRGGGRGRGRGYGIGRGYGQDRYNLGPRGYGTGRGYAQNQYNLGPRTYRANIPHQRWDNRVPSQTARINICNRCGMEGHWSKTCRTARHLVDLYQASLNDKGKQVNTNFVDIGEQSNPGDITHLDVADFLQSNPDDMTHLDVADFLVDPHNDVPNENKAHQA